MPKKLADIVSGIGGFALWSGKRPGVHQLRRVSAHDTLVMHPQDASKEVQS